MEFRFGNVNNIIDRLENEYYLYNKRLFKDAHEDYVSLASAKAHVMNTIRCPKRMTFVTGYDDLGNLISISRILLYKNEARVPEIIICDSDNVSLEEKQYIYNETLNVINFFVKVKKVAEKAFVEVAKDDFVLEEVIRSRGFVKSEEDITEYDVKTEIYTKDLDIKKSNGEITRRRRGKHVL